MITSLLLRLRMLQWRKRQRRLHKRRYWVHPVNFVRAKHGVYHSLYSQLCSYPQKFLDYFRMSVETFDKLLQLVGPAIRRLDTRFRSCLSARERLAVTLRYLATGESFSSLHYQFRLGKSTICCIVRETCQILWEKLQPLYLPHPTCDQWLSVAEKFNDVANFPNCIGAVDGKHIRIKKPAHSGSSFYNYTTWNRGSAAALCVSGR
ncbi:protein ANTAGONIST OF LIKE HETEROCHROMATIN PROTEIN 1-like [Rana temporaria]|uniref:protein ANTAGONIST OF LIKE HETEROCHROMATIN PROTEIN 1-like n=1 Tax=Rana temporaria TaxID=8407 RepID=UPI001AAE159D|nr:protein ANTAGONIST OF LIKE HETEROCHROMATIN PROTEIN 1-like [Rana temporaria]